ncbi:MAG: nickel pincer cofactor biosynthesis protein LarC [Fibrobacteria bacterium]
MRASGPPGSVRSRPFREPRLILLFDMQTGVSGDMILGALFDLGLDFEAWKKHIASLGIAGLSVSRERVSKQGLMATHVRIGTPAENAHRGLPQIRAIIDASAVPAKAKSDAVAVFTRLAEAEAGIHGIPIEQVHFHEVGALDAIVDIVGACVGFGMLSITEFYTTPFTFGSGTVQARHGTLSVPVPATLALSRGFPSLRTGLPGELCTPTGAAVISTLAKPLPAGWIGSVTRTGYGAGARDLPGIANVLRICLMDATTPSGAREDMFQVECNLDNMTPEVLGYVTEKLLAAGCKDAWQEPILMKKNRAAVKVCALADRSELDAVLSLIAGETATGGVRYFPVRRLVAAKSFETVITRYGEVEVKKSVFPGTGAPRPRYTPEYESCRRLAEAAAAPLQEVYLEALVQASLKAQAAETAAAASAKADGKEP